MDNPGIVSEGMRESCAKEEVEEIRRGIMFAEKIEQEVKKNAKSHMNSGSRKASSNSGSIPCPLCRKKVTQEEELWQCKSCVKDCPECEKSKMVLTGELKDDESYYFLCNNADCDYLEDIVTEDAEMESTSKIQNVTKKNTTNNKDNSITKEVVSVTKQSKVQTIRDSVIVGMNVKKAAMNGTQKQITKPVTQKQSVPIPKKTAVPLAPLKEVKKGPVNASNVPVQKQPVKKTVPLSSNTVVKKQENGIQKALVAQKKVITIPSMVDDAIPNGIANGVGSTNKKRKSEEDIQALKKTIKITEVSEPQTDENIGMSPMDDDDEEIQFDANPNYIPNSKEWEVLKNMSDLDFFTKLYEYLVFSYFRDDWGKIILKSKLCFPQHVVQKEMASMFSMVIAASCAEFGEGLGKLLKQIGFAIESVTCMDIETAGARKLQQNESENCYISDQKSTTGNPLKHVTIVFLDNNNGKLEKKEIQIFALESWYNFLVYYRNASGLYKYCKEFIEEEEKNLPKDLTADKKKLQMLNNGKLRLRIYENLRDLLDYFVIPINEKRFEKIMGSEKSYLKGPVTTVFKKNPFVQ